MPPRAKYCSADGSVSMGCIRRLAGDLGVVRGAHCPARLSFRLVRYGLKPSQMIAILA